MDKTLFIKDFISTLDDVMFLDHESNHHIILMITSHSVKNIYSVSREQPNVAITIYHAGCFALHYLVHEYGIDFVSAEEIAHGATYVSLMRHNLEVLRQALN